MSAMIGRSPLRKEDLYLLTGRGRFADDNDLRDQARAVFVVSPHAHAYCFTWCTGSPGVKVDLYGLINGLPRPNAYENIVQK